MIQLQPEGDCQHTNVRKSRPSEEEQDNPADGETKDFAYRRPEGRHGPRQDKGQEEDQRPPGQAVQDGQVGTDGLQGSAVPLFRQPGRQSREGQHHSQQEGDLGAAKYGNQPPSRHYEPRGGGYGFQAADYARQVGQRHGQHQRPQQGPQGYAGSLEQPSGVGQQQVQEGQQDQPTPGE